MIDTIILIYLFCVVCYYGGYFLAFHRKMVGEIPKFKDIKYILGEIKR